MAKLWLLILSSLVAAAAFARPAGATPLETLYAFNGGSPYGALIFNAKGTLLFGTTLGRIFTLNPENRNETTLHGFPSTNSDGVDAFAAVIFNAKGNLLYGTTAFGGG